MMHTKNSQLLAERLPNAHLRIYPDANHGFLNQYPELFADRVRAFLNGREDQTLESSFAMGGDLPICRLGFGMMKRIELFQLRRIDPTVDLAEQLGARG
jgi:hypothetical protein